MISDRAIKCPKCGCPNQPKNDDKVPAKDSLKRKNTPAWGKWGLLAAIPAVAFLIFMIGKDFSGTDSSEETSIAGNNGTQANININIDEATGYSTYTINDVSFVMVPVEGGTFQMGSTDSDANDDEKPVHSVTLSSYSIGQTEVTQELWKAVMGSNPSKFKGSKLPVERVRWEDCQTFLTKLNQATGKTFRLPTEAEWEFAARGGTKSQGYKYSGSNTIDDVAWYWDNGDKTHEVGTKRPNELGLYDMSGNVYEWCQDWYGSYSSSAQTNPTGASSGSDRVYRGGSWCNGAGGCRSSIRINDPPSYRRYCLGLRLAL